MSFILSATQEPWLEPPRILDRIVGPNSASIEELELERFEFRF